METQTGQLGSAENNAHAIHHRRLFSAEQGDRDKSSSAQVLKTRSLGGVLRERRQDSSESASFSAHLNMQMGNGV